MLPCRHRLVPERESYCFLESSRRTEDEIILVFSGEGEGPIKCGPELASACPFRDWTEQTARPALIACPYCKKRHRDGSNSQQLCAAWGTTKEVLSRMRRECPEGRRYYPEGTTELPYPDDTTPLIRRLVWDRLKNAVLRRDRYRCQDCGVDFGARRRKVYDAKMRRGRGGYRWESLEVHHIIARSSLGSDHPGNLKTLCPACHRAYTTEQTVERVAVQRERKQALRSLIEDGFGEDIVEDPRD